MMNLGGFSTTCRRRRDPRHASVLISLAQARASRQCWSRRLSNRLLSIPPNTRRRPSSSLSPTALGLTLSRVHDSRALKAWLTRSPRTKSESVLTVAAGALIIGEVKSLRPREPRAGVFCRGRRQDASRHKDEQSRELPHGQADHLPVDAAVSERLCRRIAATPMTNPNAENGLSYE